LPIVYKFWEPQPPGAHRGCPSLDSVCLSILELFTNIETGRDCVNSCICRLMSDAVRALPQQPRVLNVDWWVDPRNTSVTVIWTFIARLDKHCHVEF